MTTKSINSLINQQIASKSIENYSPEYINCCYIGFLTQLLIENHCEVILTEIPDIRNDNYSIMKIKRIICDDKTLYDREKYQPTQPNQSIEQQHEKEILEVIGIVTLNKLTYSWKDINNTTGTTQPQSSKKFLSIDFFEDGEFSLDRKSIIGFGENFFELIRILYSGPTDVILTSSSIQNKTHSIAKHYGLDMKFYSDAN